MSSGQQEEGIGLVELMVGLAILAIITLGVRGFFKEMSLHEIELLARKQSQTVVDQYLRLVEHDLRFRELGSAQLICGEGVCTTFAITRLMRTQQGEEGTYTVRYISQCVGLPEALKKRLSDIDFTVPPRREPGSCMARLNCRFPTYPQIIVEVGPTLPGARLPAYPGPTPHLSQGSLQSSVIGAAICMESDTQNNRIRIDAGRLTAEGQMLIESKQSIISNRNIANVQMLPNY